MTDIPSTSSTSSASSAETIIDRPAFSVRRLYVSEMNNAVYLLIAHATDERILIDAADDADALLQFVGAGGARSSLKWILTSHAHWDHTRATAALAASTGAPVAIGADDAEQLRAERGLTADLLLEHGDRLEFGGVVLEAIGLRGHTPGSMAFALSDDAGPTVLFTGDSLFPGGVGNTQGDEDRFASLFRDVTERLFDRFDDDTIVLPGHGASTTLGAERPSLPEWRERGW